MLNNNQISIIKGLDNLINLEFLWLNNNQISEIKGLDNLINLHGVALESNNISNLESSISYLKSTPLEIKVDKLDYKGLSARYNAIFIKYNPINIPRIEIVQQGKEAVIRYFEEEEEELLEAKVLLIGQGESGKTSLRNKLMDVNAELPAKGDTTRTIDITQKIIPQIEGKPLKLNIWDFGAQNIQHFAHQFFLTEDSVYVLLSNDREQNPNFQYWLSITELLGRNSPVIIVQNQKNGHCEEIKNKAAITSRFNHVVKPFHSFDIEKSATEHRQAYDNLVKDIETRALGLVTTRKKRASSMLRLREALTDLVEKKDIMRLEWSKYIELCEPLNIDKELAVIYIKAFTSIGVCIHYGDDLQLQNWVFLRPKWIIDALFMLLYADLVIINEGKFTTADTKQIWVGKEYDGMHADLLQLMKKFELCYQVSDTDKYIVPQRLSSAEDTYGWDDTDTVKIQYNYKFMPKGVITQIICRLFDKIDDKNVWNDAVIFKYKENRAFVREVYSENQILISATTVKNAELINRVIDEIDGIHIRMQEKGSALDVRKQVPCNCSKCLTENPILYDYEGLCKKLDKDIPLHCDNSYQKIDIKKLLDSTHLTYQKDLEYNLLNLYEVKNHTRATVTLIDQSLQAVKPSVLMTFAANDLAGVVTEAKKIWTSVSGNELITAQKVENADIDTLAEAIIDSDNLWFFHFGGHASGGTIALDGFRDLDKNRLANLLLPKSHKMQVIFLNGCLSQGQVGILTAQGVKAVIATNAKVNDHEAVRLANFFYMTFFKKNYTLKAAFEFAEATVIGANAFVTIVNPGGIDESHLQASSWTLFINSDHTEVMNWTLADFVNAVNEESK